MKLKDIERTANVAWSPKSQYPIYLAAGTAAQQLDASFNTNAALELYSPNLTEPGPDTKLVSSIPSDHRFHKIIWGSHGKDESSGTIIGGCDGGLIQIYSAAKLIKGESALIGKEEKHTGPVHALDFNNFQQNLFATGAGNSEIYIWDLNNTSTPMSPGTQTQPLEEILCVSWNKQVQHILASTFATKCVIWDLRKNEPIIKITDTVSRIRWKVVAWHPEVATQLCLASEEDHSPIIQLWDLRFATSPLKTLESHQRGILSLAWCTDDPDLLLSCAKDNRILCWNPNSNQQNGEVLAELAKTNQWTFDLAWCPRNPIVVASSNFDGHVSLYSLMGGKTQQVQTTNKIADSFPGMDGYVQAPVPQQTLEPVSFDMTKPPKWLKRPVGASFGFGGKLITFENDKEAVAQSLQNSQPGQPPAPIHRLINISQVITEPELVKKSTELGKALEYGNFIDYCLNKADEIDNQHKKYIWHFLKANFEQNPRTELLNLLGYSIEDVNNKLKEHVGDILQNNFDDMINDCINANRLDDFPTADQTKSKNQNANGKKDTTALKIKISDDTEGLITQALLLNNVEAAVGLCLKAKRFADALIIATTGGPELLARTQHKYLEQSEGYVSSLISAVVSEDWANIINNCDVDSWKEALAAALTHASDEDLPFLCDQLGSRLEKESSNNPKLANSSQLCYIVAGNFDKLVASWSETALKSTDNLQELVELVTFLQKAIERQGRKVEISGALAELLSHYASLLASQGDLTTALAYLGTSHDEKVVSLRERLYVTLGHKPQVQELKQQQPSRRGSHRTSFTSYPAPAPNFHNTNPFHSSNSNQFGTVPPPIPAEVPPVFNQNQFNTGLPNPTVNAAPWQVQPTPASTVNSFNQPPPKPFSPAPPSLPQPPRPTSVGSSQGGSTGLPSRKYLLDPSVSSNPYGAPTRNILPSQSLNNFQPNTYSGSTYNYNQDPSNSMMPNPVPLMPSNNMTNFNPSPLAGNSNANPVGMLNPVGLEPSPPSYTSNQGLPSEPPVENAQPALNSFISHAPSGWNDPPVVNKSTKTQSKPDVSQTDPITHPLYGTTPSQMLPSNGYIDPNSQQYNQFSAYPQAPPQMFNPPTNNVSRTYDQSGFQSNAFNQNAVQTGMPQNMQEVSRPARAETPRPVQKAPIPEEHIHMKTVLDELKNQCSYAANNPQTKRKLEDVGRKLEFLYDLLRENKLSSNTLASLHQMVQLIQNGNYTGGLNLHTQLVSGPDFAQIATFMPALKVLLQSALQLQVYIR